MSSFELYSFGSLDCPDLSSFSPAKDFFIAIEFDLKKKNTDIFMTYFFYLSTKNGFDNQKYSDELEFIMIVDEYSFDFVKNYIEKNVAKQVSDLDDEELIDYLNSNFNLEE